MGRVVRICCLWALPAFMLLAGPSVVAQDEMSVEVSLDRDTIGLDEQALLTVVVSGNQRSLPQPQLPSLSMFEVYNQGHSTNISIVNGEMTSSLTYRFVLLPSKAGVFPIKDIAVVDKNKRYKGNNVTLTVLKGATSTPRGVEERARDKEGSNRDYFLETEVDKKRPFVNQQVTLTLKFYIAVRHSTPDLTWPSTTGFWTESLSTNKAYYQQINGRNYKVYEVKRALFPTQTGEMEIGRAMITATTMTDFFFSGDQISARSAPIKIEAQPLPTQGRPKDFTGTIGKFNISARADRVEVEANQPVAVTIRISGTGNIKSVAEPPIPEMDEFRVYRASSKENVTKMHDVLGGTKIFEEVFIPKRAGRLEIPSLKFNFFNPGTGRYEEVKTQPIKLTVKPATGVASLEDVPYAPSGVMIGSESQDIRYIKSEPGTFTPRNQLIIRSTWYLLFNGLPVVVLIGMVAYRLRRQKLSGDVGYARSRAASKMARKRLSRARSLAKVETAGDFYLEISQAVMSYVADKLNISPFGLTTDRISDLLRERGADDNLINDTTAVLQKCDFARFAPSSITNEDIDRSLAAAEDVMVRMEGIRFA